MIAWGGSHRAAPRFLVAGRNTTMMRHPGHPTYWSWRRDARRATGDRVCGGVSSTASFIWAHAWSVSPISAHDSLALAKRHLERVRGAWDPPVWLDLAAYGLYALEAAVVAAVLHRGYALQRTHWSKASLARRLARQEGLPDVSMLLHDLNERRKVEAYGDTTSAKRLDPRTVAADVEAYVHAVEALLTR